MNGSRTGLALLLGAALGLAGGWTVFRGAERDPIVPFAPTPALAGEILDVAEGETFISTDGGSAYLWRRNGDRIELVGQCLRTVGAAEDQATFVWLPGVERRS